MAEVPEFELWLESEHWTLAPGDNLADEFFNMTVRLRDGRTYAMNVWTFGFLERARRGWPEQERDSLAEYLVAPDLFVERLDRELMERVVGQLVINGEMRPEWLCPPEE